MRPAWLERPAVAALLLLLLTFVAYSRAIPAGFVWDDDDYVTENVTLRSAEGLRRVWTEPGAVPQYYPLVHTSYWLEYRLWGLDPAGYHVVNILLHGLAALLLWRLLAFLRVPGAWLAAAVFALHPVHVESVAWITERKNVLSGVFYLLAFLVYLRFDPPGQAEGKRDWRLWSLSLTLFVCALLSKTVTATLPAALLLVYWWKRSLDRRRAWPLAPFFAAGLALGLMTVWLERAHVGARGEAWDLSLVERFLLAGRALWFYAWKLLWPIDLAFFYPRWAIDDRVAWQYLFPLAALAVIAGLYLRRERLGRGPLVAVLFFAGTLFPALGFFNVFPFRYSWVADHFQYLASIGLIALAAAAATTTLRRVGGRAASAMVPAAGILLALLGTLTWLQCRSYDDLETLFLDTLETNPDAWMAHNNLGHHYEARAAREPAGAAALQERADRHYEQAAEIARRLGASAGETFSNYANVLTRRGRTEDALEFYRTAIRQRPDNAAFRHNLGLAYLRLDRLEEAEAALREAIRLQPEADLPHHDLGIVLTRLGRLDEADTSFRTSLRKNPRRASTYYNAAVLSLRSGRPDRAEAQLGQAIELDPGYAIAHQSLGALLGNAGRLDEALPHLEAAARLAPLDPAARFNYAAALARLGRREAATMELAEAERLARDQNRTDVLALIRTSRESS